MSRSKVIKADKDFIRLLDMEKRRKFEEDLRLNRSPRHISYTELTADIAKKLEYGSLRNDKKKKGGFKLFSP